MKARKIRDRIYWMGSVDWDRRLFDSLVPLPDGTTYNAYLIEGSEKTVLLDSVDPPMADELLSQLEDVSKIDYIVSHHAEQDHSGTIPRILAKYPDAKLITTPKAKGMLIDLLAVTRGIFHNRQGWRDLVSRRQDFAVYPCSLGPLARDHGDLSERGQNSFQL